MRVLLALMSLPLLMAAMNVRPDGPPMAHDTVTVTNATRQPLTDTELARFSGYRQGGWGDVLEGCAPRYKYHLYNGEKRLRVLCSHLSGFQSGAWIDVDPARGLILQVKAAE